MWFSIVPNPAQNSVFIKYSGIKSKNDLTISIYAINGRKLISKSMHHGNTTIDTSELADGIYLCIINDTNGAFVSQQKLTIIR